MKLLKNKKIFEIFSVKVYAGVDVILLFVITPILMLIDTRSENINIFIDFMICSVSVWTIFIGIILSLLIHEFCHIFVGRTKGLSFSRVNLHIYGAGAICDNEIELKDPDKEIETILAGPAASAGLAGILSIGVLFFDNYYFNFFSKLNLILAIFNLIPIYPMDGGRLFRSLLSKRINSFYSNITAKILSIILICSVFITLTILKGYWILIIIFILFSIINLYELSEDIRYLKISKKINYKINYYNLSKIFYDIETISKNINEKDICKFTDNMLQLKLQKKVLNERNGNG